MNHSGHGFYSPFFAPITFTLLALLPLANWLLLPGATAVRVTEWIDSVPAVIGVYGLAMIVLLVYKPSDNTSVQNRCFCLFEVLTFCAMLRELGVQHWLTQTDTTAFKSRFFLNPNNPLHEKIVAGAILLALLAIAVYLLVRYLPFLIREFFRFGTVAWTMATLAAVVVIAKAVDRFPDNYHRWTGEELSGTWDVLRASFEEFYEAYIPICIIVAALQFARLRSRKIED